MDCNNIPTGAPNLNHTNNETGACLVNGSVAPIQSSFADKCGGVITYNWTFVDQCGNPISHSQNITVTPAPPSSILNPPADIVVDCNSIPTGAPSIDFTNNAFGNCLIQGSLQPSQIGNPDVCGGTYSFIWQGTDECGNNLTHTQNVTISPPPPPVFINPPVDQILSCNSILTAPSNLSYSNFETGSCLVNGSVAPTQSGNIDICGGTITYNWTFTDQCNNTISHTQNITVEPVPPATFTDVLPTDMVVSCDAFSNVLPSLNYNNNDVGQCQIAGSIPAIQTGTFDECGGFVTYNWEFTDLCGRTIQHQQNITITPVPMADFIDPPWDIVLDCSEAPTSLPLLNYSNGIIGQCSIEGSILPDQFGSPDPCGGFLTYVCLLYTSPSPRDQRGSRMPSSA